MPVHVLRFVSPAKAFRLAVPPTPHTCTVNDWTLSETLQPHPDEELRKNNVYEYHVVMEKNVQTEADLSPASGEATALARELELAWCYAAGRPFRYMRHFIIQFTPDTPLQWSGNYKEVKQAIREATGQKLFAELRFNNRNWQDPPFLPLETAVQARAAYLEADPVLRDLIDLHVGAFIQYGQSRFILLAKALEFVGSFYPDASGAYTREARNGGLQELLSDTGNDKSLTQSVKWLFDTANARREIRHVWDTKAGDFHPELTVQEMTDFVWNADLVVRVFICWQLSLPVVTYLENPCGGLKQVEVPK